MIKTTSRHVVPSVPGLMLFERHIAPEQVPASAACVAVTPTLVSEQMWFLFVPIQTEGEDLSCAIFYSGIDDKCWRLALFILFLCYSFWHNYCEISMISKSLFYILTHCIFNTGFGQSHRHRTLVDLFSENPLGHSLKSSEWIYFEYIICLLLKLCVGISVGCKEKWERRPELVPAAGSWSWHWWRCPGMPETNNSLEGGDNRGFRAA